MACPRCRLRLQRTLQQPDFRAAQRRTFHLTSPRRRLGAATYAQEWQTGTYHYNKAHTKTLPTATTHTDNLLQAYATQQKRRAPATTEAGAYNILLRNSIAAQRRKSDRVFISRSTAKDFGNKVVVQAFVYDGNEAAAREEERKRKARMGVKPGGGEGGDRKRGPARRRGPSGPGGVGGGGARTPGFRAPGTRRMGGAGAGAGGGETAFRSLNFRRGSGGAGGSGSGSGAKGPPRRT